MNELDKFADIFRRRLDGIKQSQLRFAVCKSVDWGEKTMTADGVSDDVPYKGVQLGFGYVDVKPKVGSVCLIGILEGKEALTFLINAEAVEQVEINIGKLKIEASPEGLMSVKNDRYSLKKTFDDLITAIKLITVTTATGPSGTPINAAQFDLIKMNLTNLLK